MNKAVLSSVLMALCLLTLAQVPESFSYQAVVRDGVSNNPLTNQDVSFKMIILKGGTSGTEEYTEYHAANTGALGIVNLVIGNGTDKTGTISNIDWGADSYYLKVMIDKTGGSTYVEMGTTQLLSVPYALHSKAAETADDAVKLTGDQTISGKKTFTETTTVPIPINSTDAATKAYVDELKIMILDLQAENGVTDARDGTHYSAVRIGNQIWMAENLAYLPVVHSNAEFQTQGNNSQPGYGVNGYDGSDIATAKSQANYSTYGVLYNWWAAMDGASSSSSNPSGVQGVCPTGWHLPSDDEWTTMENYLIANGYNYDGTTTDNKIAKALAATTNWEASHHEGAVGNTDYPAKRNVTGFTALPGGFRNYNGSFNLVGLHGYWWSATEYDASNAWYHYLQYDTYWVSRQAKDKYYGVSVRCVRD